MRPSRILNALTFCVLIGIAAACSSDEQVEPLVVEDHVDVDRQVDLDPAPPNLPYLPDYLIDVCGWAGDQSAVSCFKQAQEASRGAEIFFRYGTIEGDAIFAIARLSPAGDIVLYTDHSDDAYSGPQQFRSRTCSRDDFNIDDGEIPWESCGEETPGW